MSERPVTTDAASEQSERLSALFTAHADRLYRLARRLVRSADDARDLVQETFLKAARARSIPDGPAAEEAWLVRVLVNTRRDQWRRDIVRKRYDAESGGQASADTPRCDPENALVVRATVWRALDRLPPRRRAVIVMHEIEGLAVRTIASLVGISAITVRWHLSRGRRELARALRIKPGATHEQPAEHSVAGRGSSPSRTIAR
jgi:RNA polymerase sigma-70 factor (ECF subfamily)